MSSLPQRTGVRELIGLVEGLRSLDRKVQEWLTLLPDTDGLLADYQDAISIYEEAHALVGSHVDRIIEKGKLTPDDLRAAINIVKTCDYLQSFPDWAWNVEDARPDNLDHSITNAHFWVDRLVVPQVRERVKSILESLAGCGKTMSFSEIRNPHYAGLKIH